MARCKFSVYCVEEYLCWLTQPPPPCEGTDDDKKACPFWSGGRETIQILKG